MFFRRDRYALVRADAVDLKTCDADAFANDEERDVAEWVRAQPHLRRTLANVSTVGIVATLEPKPVTDDKDDGKPSASRARGDVTVANAHLFFQPGATHVRILQTRWLLRHADIARKRREAELLLSTSGGASRSPGAPPPRPPRCALVVCGDMNAEPFDGAARFAAEGRSARGTRTGRSGARSGGGARAAAPAAGIVARGRGESAPGDSGEGGAPRGAPRARDPDPRGGRDGRRRREKKPPGRRLRLRTNRRARREDSEVDPTPTPREAPSPRSRHASVAWRRAGASSPRWSAGRGSPAG